VALPIFIGLAVHGFLEDLDVGNIVLALGELLCLEDVLPVLTDSDAPVLVADFHGNGLLVFFAIELDRSDLGWQEAVLEELFRVAVVFHNLDLLAHDFGCLLDGGTLLANRKPHVTGVDHEDETLVAVIDHTVAAPCAGQALELGDEAHAVFGQFYFYHIMPSSGKECLTRPESRQQGC
jgi:hypothetical protein